MPRQTRPLDAPTTGDAPACRLPLKAGITAWAVNAHFIKDVSGRKTDMLDSEWLAMLARFDLVRGSFIPPKDLRELRLVSRCCRKLNALCRGQINRLHKILDDAGIKLGAVVSDIHGVSARAMVRGLIEGPSEAVLLAHARGTLKRKTEERAASLDGELSERDLFVRRHLRDSIEARQRQLAEIDAYRVAAMKPYARAHGLLQILLGIDQVAAALIFIETGDDMSRFGSPQRLVCWAALSPGKHETAGKRKSGRTRHGNNVIRYILCECANAARWIKSTLTAKCKSLMVRKSDKKGHRGRGAQDDPADLHSAVSPRALPRSGHRLRRHLREEERASLGIIGGLR